MYEVRSGALLQLSPRRHGWRRAHGLHRDALIATCVAAAVGCGRVGFDARNDAGGDSVDALGATASISLQLPAGGQFRDLAVSPVDGSWYAVAYFGGVYTSTSAGDGWKRCGALAATAVEVASDGAVFASGANAWRSTDGCATWTLTNAPTSIYTIGIVGTTTYALGGTALYSYGGTGWIQVPTPADPIIYTSFAGVSGGARVAGTYEGGLVVSTDGTSWTQKTTGFATLDVVDVAVASTGMYAVTTAGGGTNGGVSCSDGTGATWTPCHDVGGLAIAIDPLDPQHVVFAVYDELGDTRNAFGNFTVGLREASGMTDAIVWDLLYTPSGTLIAATERGVFAAPPGPIAFEEKLTGLSSWTIEDIVRDGDDVFVATSAGVLRSRSKQLYTLSTTGMTAKLETGRFAFAPDGTLLVPGRALWSSTDRGTTWQEAWPLAVTDGYYAHVLTFAGARAFAGTRTRLLVADPPYTTWTAHLVGGATAAVFDLAAVDGQLYIATPRGLFVSGDSAMTSQLVIDVDDDAHAIAILADGGLAVATHLGMHVSNPTRTTWERTLNTTKCDEVVLAGDRIVAISFDDGVFVSADRGVTWTPVTTPPGVHIRTALYDPVDGSLVLGTYGHGLIAVTLP